MMKAMRIPKHEDAIIVSSFLDEKFTPHEGFPVITEEMKRQREIIESAQRVLDYLESNDRPHMLYTILEAEQVKMVQKFHELEKEANDPYHNAKQRILQYEASNADPEVISYIRHLEDVASSKITKMLVKLRDDVLEEIEYETGNQTCIDLVRNYFAVEIAKFPR